MPSSTTSSKGCGWRVVPVAISATALAVAALFTIGAASTWWQGYRVRTKWPEAPATLRRCALVAHRRRNSIQLAYVAECAISFKAGTENVSGGIESLAAYYEHRPSWWANPGIDELRAWIAAHPPGSGITIHYNPEWPPQTEPFPAPPIFDRYSNALMLRLAGIAAVIGISLGGLALAVPR